MSSTRAAQLQERIDSIAEVAGTERFAAAFHDYESGERWERHGGEWFHAASTIKVPVLVGVFAAIEAHDLSIDSRVHVRNQFHSVIDHAPFRIDASRDANSEVHAAIGKTMKLSELARHMIVTSSNLATNLLIEAVGLDRVQRTLKELGVDGVELRRGVEDERAYQEGIINRVTANGLVQVLRLIEEKKAVSAGASDHMLDILHEQEFRSGIPAGVPDDARVANKTGEISTVAHDTGLVYPKDREPYALAILTQWDPGRTSRRRDTLAKISRAVYEHLTGEGRDG
jgi:beta-lactamase class A